MKQILIIISIGLFFICGKQEINKNSKKFSKVIIETVLEDSLLNCRAIDIHYKTKSVLAATARGNTFVKYEGSDQFIALFEDEKDTVFKPNFRSAVMLDNSIFTLSIASPALLYKNGKLVYKETHENAFYDAMAFWNDSEGIAIGDTIDGCLSIIITRDAGETWHKLSCSVLPKSIGAEGAFAASNTNISIVGNHTWIGTTAGRVLYSPDRGKTWDVVDTPIIKQKDTEGIYSIAFFDDKNGFAIGGDYTKPNDSSSNKIRTTDGGKTWQLVAANKSPGYRSCVQYVPGTDGKGLVAIGFKGIDYSSDSGNTWNPLSDEGFYTIRFLNDSVAYAAGNKRISKLMFK